MITKQEYLSRLANLQRKASENGLEAFLVSSEESIYYPNHLHAFAEQWCAAQWASNEHGKMGRCQVFKIVLAALEYCKANGVKRVLLRASEAGKPIYERIGFVSSPEMMRISLE
jgi:hypothetical protein